MAKRSIPVVHVRKSLVAGHKLTFACEVVKLMPSTRPHLALIGNSLSAPNPNEKSHGVVGALAGAGASNASAARCKHDTEQERVYVASSEHLLQKVLQKLENRFRFAGRNGSGSSVDEQDELAFCQRAFKFFRGDDDSGVPYITCRMFLDHIPQLGFCVSRRTGVQAFNRIDQRRRGRMEFEVFADWLVPGIQVRSLPMRGMAAMAKSIHIQVAGQDPEGASAIPDATRSTTGSELMPHSSETHLPQQEPASQTDSDHSPALDVYESKTRELTHLSYESMSTAEIEYHIAQKMLARTSKDTDRFRQAFRFFTKSENITSQDFHSALHRLHIPLSFKRAKEVFDQFDLDGNGCIELYEFTLTLFKKETEELSLFGSGSMVANGNGNGNGNGNTNSGTEVGSPWVQLPMTTGPAEVNSNTTTPTNPSGGTGAGAGSGQANAVSSSSKADESHLDHGLSGTATSQDVLRIVKEKIQQKASKESDQLRQALFRNFGKVSAIGLHDLGKATVKLGLRLSTLQIKQLFEELDMDKSGDLDLNKIVRGLSRDEKPLIEPTNKDKEQLEREKRQELYDKAVQSMQNNYSLEELEQILREKIEQRTSRSSDCFRQAFRIFKKVNGIRPDEFHRAMRACGISIDRQLSDKLFVRYDANQSGDLDLDEFIQGILPQDYTGRQWVAAADEMHCLAAAEKKQASANREQQYMTQHEMENWSLDEIEKRIRDKIEQATSKSSDSFRQAYKIFHKSNHVTIQDFRQRLLAFGFRLTDAQCEALFKRYDTNGSNDLDLQEFCLRVLPPDYTKDSDKWFLSELELKSQHQEKIDFVKQTRNGLLVLGNKQPSTPLQAVGASDNAAPERVSTPRSEVAQDVLPISTGGLDESNVISCPTRSAVVGNANALELLTPVAPRPRTTGCCVSLTKNRIGMPSPRASSRVVMAKMSGGNATTESKQQEQHQDQDKVLSWEELKQDAVRTSAGARVCTPRLSNPIPTVSSSFSSCASPTQSEDTLSTRSTTSVGSVGRAKYKPQFNSALLLQRMVQGTAGSATKSDELSMSSPVFVASARVHSVPKSAAITRVLRNKQV